MKRHKMSRLFLGFVKLTGVIPVLIFFKPRIHYMNRKVRGLRLPKPAILMSNHMSLLDFPLYLLVFPFRSIRFLMSEALYGKNNFFAWFLDKLGGIFVDREAYSLGFVGESLEALEKGGTVGVFPEGRLPIKGEYHPFKPGIVYIALRTDAPIIPVYTAGGYSLTKRTNIMIGEPFYIHRYCDSENPDSKELARLTKILEEENGRLKAELERRLCKDENK